MGRRKRRRVDPTDDWQQLELLCAWEEQREYERIRPLVLFGGSVPERSSEIGVSERVLYRKIAAFREEGMRSLFNAPKAKRRVLPPAIRRAIVDLKAEHLPLNLEEITNICGILFGRRPDGQTVKAVLEESAIPRKLVRRFLPYHEIPDDRERREAAVTLHLEGWSELAAGGGMGTLLVQLARAAGARVVGAARGEKKLGLVRELGAEFVVDYSETGWAERAREATGGAGPDVVFDGVGGRIGNEAFDIVARGGRFSAHGASSGDFAEIDPQEAGRRGVRVTGIERVQFSSADAGRLAERAMSEAAAGRLRPVVGQTFPLERAAEAHAAMEARGVVGKTLLLA